jgi:mannosyltransferase OCH1-like enzyme
MSSSIPKIIHQLWIGPKPAPTNFMNTWKDKNPDFEYIFWNEQEMQKRKLFLRTPHKIDEMSEINGKADIIRWEILYQYGGVFIDADSICIEPLDNILMREKAFAGYENEIVRKDLVATGTMGFPRFYPLCKDAVEWILANDISVERTGMRAWMSVGPGLLTRLLQMGKYPEVKIFPSYFFLPIHHTGMTYTGHSKVYAYQEWGSTKQNYEIMNNLMLPEIFQEPKEWVSVLISSYNTNPLYIDQCLESVRNQNGYFGIEVVWIDDGSSKENSKKLQKLLKQFKKITRFTRYIYEKNAENRGVGYSLHKGVLLCKNEMIVKMDSDDIMVPDRIKIQLEFMNKTKDAVVCGSNVQYIREKTGISNQYQRQYQYETTGQTNHPTEISWDKYTKMRYHWFMNHITCIT